MGRGCQSECDFTPMRVDTAFTRARVDRFGVETYLAMRPSMT
jgi:hypothetical protein